MRPESEHSLVQSGPTRVLGEPVLGGHVPFVDLPTGDFQASATFTEPPPLNPKFIGRYQVIRPLGNGGFGRVELAYDDVLKRNVAIKIPHHHLVEKQVEMELYLNEARVVSGLDHQYIVPVYDCGHTTDGLCYVVSKYIDGSDLATKLKRSPYSIAAAADLVASIADALHYAHINKIVHRDVKLANILIDAQGRPYLADFGLALREQDFGKGQHSGGTVAYMSPEQLRGEGHLVDGRSDIFSLGVVLYKLITGKMPFPANRLELQTTQVEPRPPRQIDDSIPKELERICLKALSYRVIDRYNTASDLAVDLRLFLQGGNATHASPAHLPGLSHDSNNPASNNPNSGVQRVDSGVLMVPKGLRSFDRDDAGFFLELLPGPRGRDGLPESVQLWKKRILESEAETFRVGVIYGPSGCGKSSFLKAAVIPQLNDQIVPVYVESTPHETETRLLKSIRKAFPELSPDLGLADSLTTLRRQRRGESGQRLLIVLDQFEQWLHARPQGDSGELVKALRQCDGVNIQCIITVRDDFWMAVTHFMDELEVSLVPDNNLAVIDLFNLRHARRVLTAIGQAYGILPPKFDEISEEHKAFINNAVADLAQNDRVIPVQLALFAEMVKDKEWSTATLKSLGGMEGVGVTFLEETFNGRTANPHHRLQQRAARAVLQTLLPEGETGIKGSMRSYQELLRASGYSEKPQEFEPLLRILDSELRLITPTDPEGLDPDSVSAMSVAHDHERYYHLTHDYLVPSLQEWLTQKRKETRRGRAELVLADRAAAWNKHPSNRSLPSFFEWIGILLFAGQRTKSECRPALRAATQYYGGRTLLGGCVLGLAITGVLRSVHITRGTSLVESLSNATCAGVPKLIESLEPYWSVAQPHLEAMSKSSDSPTTRLYASMALMKVDPTKQADVYEGLLQAAPDDFATICDLLKKWGDGNQISKNLWEELSNPKNSVQRRLRAGAALAKFDAPDDANPSDNWRAASGFLAAQLVSETDTNPSAFNDWVSALRPTRNVLYSDLHRIFASPESPEKSSHAAAKVLADFAAGQAEKLVDLVYRAKPSDYEVLSPRLKELGHEGEAALLREYNLKSPDGAAITVKNEFAKRRAYAAVTLLEFENTPPLLEILSVSEDPTLSTYAEDRLSKLGIQPEIVYRLMTHAETNLRASLLRSLAGMSGDRFSIGLRDLIATAVSQIFQNDADGGIHSAAEWAMRTWGMKTQLAELTQTQIELGQEKSRNWYINHQGQTMIVFKGPITSRMGSPREEAGRDSDEDFCYENINYDFAICSTETTVKQFLNFLPDFRHGKKMDYSPNPDCPIVYLTWYRAAEYCNLLSESEGIPETEWCYSRERRFIKTNLRPEGEWMDTWQPKKGYLSCNGYRLPTEAEWEFACRAGTTTEFSWGREPDVSIRYARTIINSQGTSSVVGSYSPNRYGLFDMHGNAMEWVQDRYFDGIKEPRSNLANDGGDVLDDTHCVVRGGSAGDLVNYQRSGNRASAKARDGVSPRLGFRVSRTMTRQ